MAYRTSRSAYDLNVEEDFVRALFAGGETQPRLLWSQRALAAFSGAILRLPPARRLLAAEQVRSPGPLPVPRGAVPALRVAPPSWAG
jgi:hypothetical protein